MITLENDRLVFRFPDVHEAATCTIGFHGYPCAQSRDAALAYPKHFDYQQEKRDKVATFVADSYRGNAQLNCAALIDSSRVDVC